MADLWVIKIDGVLHADGDESLAVMDKLPSNKPLQCEVKNPRNAKHHRLFFKLVSRVVAYLDRDDINTESVLVFLKMATGMAGKVKTKTFGDLAIYGSISFAKMDQSHFAEWFEKCVRFIIAEWQIPYEVYGDLLGEVQTEKR